MVTNYQFSHNAELETQACGTVSTNGLPEMVVETKVFHEFAVCTAPSVVPVACRYLRTQGLAVTFPISARISIGC